MKKSIFIFCTVLAVFGLTALGCRQSNDPVTEEEITYSKAVVFDFDPLKAFNEKADPDLFYKVDSRFNTTVTKEDLHNAKSILDILPENATHSREAYHNVRVSILHDDHETTEMGENEMLNAAQLELLRSAGYSTNFRITSICRKKAGYTGAFRTDSLVYYMTIIPEREAQFTNGYDALIDYLKENSKDKTGIISKDQLKPGKVRFTVTKNGTIANVKLNYTSGYPTVDDSLIKLISSMPEKWAPATNSKGEKVDQEFIFFFGLEGC